MPQNQPISPKIIDAYSCKKVLSPQEYRQHCSRLSIFSGGANKAPKTLSATQKLYKVGWGTTSECPGGIKHPEQGTYRVTVTKVKGGWIATRFTTMSGPFQWSVSE